MGPLPPPQTELLSKKKDQTAKKRESGAKPHLSVIYTGLP